MQLRRSFGTIHAGHLNIGWLTVEDYYMHLRDSELLHGDDRITYAAFALEQGEESGTIHVQFYMEHSRMLPSTLANLLDISTGAVFDVVRDAQGSWDYCTGTGRYDDKPAMSRFQFGTPKLFGSSAKADLQALVSMVIEGENLESIMRQFPYSYCVHRARIVAFHNDWKYGVGRNF